jgi:hypothetical protein
MCPEGGTGHWRMCDLSLRDELMPLQGGSVASGRGLLNTVQGKIITRCNGVVTMAFLDETVYFYHAFDCLFAPSIVHLEGASDLFVQGFNIFWTATQLIQTACEDLLDSESCRSRSLLIISLDSELTVPAECTEPNTTETKVCAMWRSPY